MNKPLTLFDAVQLWEQSHICESTPRLRQNLATVMRNYILPVAFGLKTSRLRSDYLSVMREIPLVDFLAATDNVLNVFSNPDDYGVSASTFRYYRNVAVKFFDFLYCLINDSQVTANFSPIPQFLPPSESIPKQKGLSESLRTKKISISLTDEGLSSIFRSEVEAFRRYALKQDYDLTTIDNYLGHIFYFLGWLLSNKSYYNLSDLSLDLVTDDVYSHSFIEWGLIERGNSLGWATGVVHACILTARFLSDSGGDYDEELVALRNYLRVINEQLFQDKNDLKVIEKKLTFSMAVKVVDYLRSCCAVNHGNGSPRSDMAIVKSWQRYLLVGLLVFCPIRSSHLCQLTINHSLVWEGERFYVDLSVLNSRVSSTMMNRIPIPSFLSEDLLKWCQDLRPLVGSKNDSVFMKLGSPRCPQSKGEPLSVKDLSDIVSGCISKATLNLFGKAISLSPTSLSGLKNDYLQMLAMMEKTIDDSHIIAQIDLKDLRNERPRRELGEISNILEQVQNLQKERKKYPFLTDLEPFK